MGGRFIDFDAAWDEVASKSDPPGIRVRGEDIELPRGMPAKLALFARRHAGDEGEIDSEFMDTYLGLLVGPERVARWLDEGMTLPQLADVFYTCAAIYRGGGQGEARPPATGASSKTSSKGGPSSRPTGAASTTGT